LDRLSRREPDKLSKKRVGGYVLKEYPADMNDSAQTTVLDGPTGTIRRASGFLRSGGRILNSVVVECAFRQASRMDSRINATTPVLTCRLRGDPYETWVSALLMASAGAAVILALTSTHSL
jgi:hypothetical protein